MILKPSRMMQVIEKRIFEKEAEKKEKKNNLRSHPFGDAGENPGKYIISKT